MAIANRYKGILFVSLSALILSAASPVIAKLIQVGNSHLIHGHNPISFCNVLLAGNVIAIFTLLSLHYREVRSFDYRTISLARWLLISAGALVSGFFTPTLYFLGIMYTSVVNVVLISTLQVPLTLFLGWFIMKERPCRPMVIGSTLMVLGIITVALLQNYYFNKPAAAPAHVSYAVTGPISDIMKLSPHSGIIAIFLAVMSSTTSTFLGFRAIKTLPQGVFSIIRLSLGVFFFFWIALAAFGRHHFADIFSDFLWEWMLLYGGVIVALRIYFMFLGLRHAKVAEVIISSALVPVFSLFFAYLIMGEIPTAAQLIGSSIIMTGILIALIGELRNIALQQRLLKKAPCFPGV